MPLLTLLALVVLAAPAACAPAPEVGPAGPIEGGPRSPRINMPTNSPFQPYRSVEKCPPGTVTKVVDWPKPGDMACEPSADAPEPAPGERVPSLRMRTQDVSAPYRDVPRCPRGTRPVIYGEPPSDDMLCDRDHSIKEWDAEPEGDGPRINIPTNDPFKPYKTVTTCPPDTLPVVADWPRPGDMACHPGRPSSPARRR